MMHLMVGSRSTVTELDVEKVLDDVHRVRNGSTVLGYVLIAGPVYVSLKGPVFNISEEVGQSYDLDTAVRILARA